MNEPNPPGDGLEIKILGEPTDSGLGSRVKEKRSTVKVEMVTVTSENWQQYFPARELTQDTKTDLESGNLYLKAAVDPENNATAGRVEVYRNQDNALSVYVEEEYQRMGVASGLIRQAQSDHDHLHLLNHAGIEGASLYWKMGFVPEGVPNHFIWRRENST